MVRDRCEAACLFLANSVTVVDLVGPRAIAPGEGSGLRRKALGPTLKLDYSKDAPICGRMWYNKLIVSAFQPLKTKITTTDSIHPLLQKMLH